MVTSQGRPRFQWWPRALTSGTFHNTPVHGPFVSNLSTVPEHPDDLEPEGGTFFPFDTNFAHEPLVGHFRMGKHGPFPQLFMGIRSGIVVPPGTVKSYRMTESHSLPTEIPLRPNVSRGRTKKRHGIDRGQAPEPSSSAPVNTPEPDLDVCLCETMTTYTAVKTVTTTTHRDTTTEDRRRRR